MTQRHHIFSPSPLPCGGGGGAARGLLLLCCLLLPCPATAHAAGNGRFVGHIVDGAGRPVAGAELFAYDSPATRRPADFISPPSDGAGAFRMAVPSGKYWLVARLRSGEKFGPLSFGGRHSGEALEAEVDAGGEVPLDFTVLDVREAARAQRQGDDCREVTGRLLDQRGKPVAGAYAFTRREGGSGAIPEFLSVLSDRDGRFSICLPQGSHCLAASISFPPEEGTFCSRLDVTAEKNVIANDLHLNYSVPAVEETVEPGQSLD